LQAPVQLGQVTPYENDIQEETARRFALALQAGDTVKMRQLSLPISGSKMATAFAEVPRASTDFGQERRRALPHSDL
jgi:hypothetical protein